MHDQREFNPGDQLSEHVQQLRSAVRAAHDAVTVGEFTHAEWAESLLRVMRTAVEVSALEPPGSAFRVAMRAAASGTEADAHELLAELDRWSLDLAKIRNSPEPTRPV